MTLNAIARRVSRFVQSHKHALRAVDFIVGVSRGGLIPAALIATRLDKPLIAIYIDRRDRVYLDRRRWIRGKRVLLVDDIVRTGATLAKMIALVKRTGAQKVQSFTLFSLPHARVRPTWTHRIALDRRMPWDLH